MAKLLRDEKGRWAGSAPESRAKPPVQMSGAERAHRQREALENLRAAGGVVDAVTEPDDYATVYSQYRESDTSPHSSASARSDAERGRAQRNALGRLRAAGGVVEPVASDTAEEQ